MSDEFDDVEPDSGEAGSKRVWIIIGLSVVGVLVLGAAAWFARPVYRHFKEARNLRQSEEFFHKGDLRNGLLCLRQALAANPNNLEASRKMAEILSEAQSPAALGWWRRVVELSPTPENRVQLAATALRVERPPFSIATQTLDELQKSGGETNVAYHLVASQLAIRLNRAADAATHLAEAVRLEPTNRLHQLNLATLRLRQPDAATAAKAREELTALVSDPMLAEHALRSLVADSLTERRYAEAERLSDQLLTLGKARFDDRLQHLNLLATAGNVATNQWLEQLKQEAATNVLKIASVAGWMGSHGQPRAALDWLTTLDGQLRTNQPLPLVASDCYVALKDWPGLEKFLTEQNWEDQEAVRLTLLVRALREQGRREVADSQWRRVLATPSGRGEALGAVAQLAAGWGWKQEAEDALWALVKRSPWQDWAWQLLIRTREEAGDTPGLYRVYSTMLEKKPSAVGLKNNVAATGLLVEPGSEKCRRLAREVYLAATNNPTFVSTYAYALHLQGQSEEALRLMQTLPEKELQRSGVATYYAVILAKNGQRERATAFAAFAEKGRPLPEEKRLLETLKTGK